VTNECPHKECAYCHAADEGFIVDNYEYCYSPMIVTYSDCVGKNKEQIEELVNALARMCKKVLLEDHIPEMLKAGECWHT